MHQNKPGKIFAVVQKPGDKKIHGSQQFLCICTQTESNLIGSYSFLQTNFSARVELLHGLLLY